MVFLVIAQGDRKGVNHTKATIICLSIWDGGMYVDVFGDTWMQLNNEHAFDMGLLYVVRTCSSHSHLSWVVHLLQNFLTWSIVMLMLLPVGMAKVVIDILFMVLCYCLPVHNEQEIQEHVLAKCNSP